MKISRITLIAAIVLAVSGGELYAAKKVKPDSRSNYTKAQQAAYFKQALTACRKKYSSFVHEVKVDYRKRQYVCYVYR
jgi:hypothetical protein